jgi:sarcosine oxidase, subunit beta
MTRKARDHPTKASVVIIGGGVMGVSTAYHLAAAGVKEVVLVDRDALGSGSTCKAAGGVRAQFSDRINIELGLRSLRAFETFRDQFNQEIDLRQVGYLFLLDSPDDVTAFEENVSLQNELGVPSRVISVAEAKRMSPLIETEGLLAATYSPTDGHCTPEAVVLGYASVARRLGARLLPGCAAIGVETVNGQIVGVETEGGRIETDTVVCAAGPWSQEVAAWVGVDLPVTPIRRQVVITGPISGLDPRTPFTIDFGSSFYFHAEGNGLLIGMSDPRETPGFKLTRSDEWLSDLSETMQRRTPSLVESEIVGGWAGLYESTPDHNALIGEAEDVGRFLYAAGFSGHGFLMGPAVGQVMRDLYLGTEPFLDISDLHARRFARSASRPETNIV